jgi:hypothetical protein
MTKLLATAALLFAACGGATRSSPQTATTTSGGTDHAVDPTVPSWTPKSCIAYHKVTIEALDCPAIEQSKRDQIERDYGEASQAWKREEDADKANVEQIALACERSSESVHAEIAGNCAKAE